MKNNNSDKLIIFSFGSIGEFLMLLNICCFIKKSNPNFDAIIFSTKNHSLLKEMAGMYDFISIKPLRFKNLFKFLLCGEGRRSTILMPFTFGDMPKKILFVSKIIKLFSRAKIIGFSGLDYGNHIKKSDVSFDESMLFDLSKLFYKNILSLLDKSGFRYVESNLFYLYKKQLKNNFEKDYIVMHITASNSKRSLPFTRWRIILNELNKHNIPVYFTGSFADRKNIFEVTNGFNNAHNFAGQIDFYQLADLIYNCRVFVGVDTGITHLAGVLGVSGVIVGNNSNPTWLPYYNKNFKILTNNSRCTCTKDKDGDCLVEVDGKKYARCMYDVPDELIIKEIKNQYEKNIIHNK